jgi:hypothetical protein
MLCSDPSLPPDRGDEGIRAGCTARNRATDRLRREAVGAAKLRQVAATAACGEPAPDEAAASGVADDRLRLIFTCCHPALALEARVALTLRTLGCGRDMCKTGRRGVAARPLGQDAVVDDLESDHAVIR